MDTVFIEGLEIEALIGIYDWERRIRQPLVFDIEMAFDNRVPAASDAIADTLDYKAVSKRLIAFASASDFGLVETLAERCAALILDEFGVRRVRLKLSKPGAVRGARAVGVIIERERPEAAPPLAMSAPAGTESEAATKADSAASPEALAPEPVAAPAMATASPAPAPASEPAVGDAQQRKLASRFRARVHAGRHAYLSLGSNVEPEKNLRSAIAALRERFGQVQVSPVYRTRAVGFDGPDFLNAIAQIECDTDPFALHRWLHRLEEAHGRDSRDSPYSNRPLDIDIVYFGGLVLEVGVLQLPRPELRYAFVLKPMADLAPDFVDPLRDATMAELWAAHPDYRTPPAQVEVAL